MCRVRELSPINQSKQRIMTNKANSNENVDVTSLTYQELYERHLVCPINNGADLNSDTMLDSLFDDGQYVENRAAGRYVALGFVDGIPVRCEYNLGLNCMTIHTLLSKKEYSYSSLNVTLPERLSDDLYFSKITYCGSGVWMAHFFYRSAD